MSFLYAPWRASFIKAKKSKSEPAACVFCTQAAADDDENFFILRKNEKIILMLNYYPYNIGHLLILPRVHASTLSSLQPETRAAMMEEASFATQLLATALNAESFNIGFNIGPDGGGTIPEHLHMHILPRWRGDTTFLETLHDTRIISQDMQKFYLQLKNLIAATNI
jgi:ATP adenylyltransferase